MSGFGCSLLSLQQHCHRQSKVKPPGQPPPSPCFTQGTLESAWSLPNPAGPRMTLGATNTSGAVRTFSSTSVALPRYARPPTWFDPNSDVENARDYDHAPASRTP